MSTGDARVPALALGADGVRIAVIGGSSPLGITGGVITLRDGQSVSISLNPMGYPDHAVVNGVVFLFANYTDSTVDIAALTPSGKLEVARSMPVNPRYMARLQQQHARIVAAMQKRAIARSGPRSAAGTSGAVQASSGDWDLSTLGPAQWVQSVAFAGGAISCWTGAAAAAAALSAETLGLSALVWVALCTSSAVTIAATYTGTTHTDVAHGAEIVSTAGSFHGAFECSKHAGECTKLIGDAVEGGYTVFQGAAALLARVKASTDKLWDMLAVLVAGSWTGSGEDASGTMTLQQYGSTITGSGVVFADLGPVEVQVAGAVTGRSVTLNFSAAEIEPFAFTGTVSADRATMSGVMNGSGAENSPVVFVRQ